MFFVHFMKLPSFFVIKISRLIQPTPTKPVEAACVAAGWRVRTDYRSSTANSALRVTGQLSGIGMGGWPSMVAGSRRMVSA